MSLFDRRIQAIVAVEGGYVDHPNDRGGPTIYGITQATAQAFGYRGAMQDMAREQAITIYRERYWVQPGFDKIETIDPAVSIRLLDIGITSGPTVGVKFLQRALNSLNKQGSLYPDIARDGVAGAMTRAAMEAFIKGRGENGRAVLLGMIAAQQSQFYLDIAEGRPANESFEYGWQLNRALGKTVT